MQKRVNKYLQEYKNNRLFDKRRSTHMLKELALGLSFLFKVQLMVAQDLGMVFEAE